jgi:hypothetical protein
MADSFAIDIFPIPNAPAGQPTARFSPNPATVKVGNIVFFRNNDEVSTHWPVASSVPNTDPNKPDPKNPDLTGWWMDSPISTALPGEPTPSKEAFTPSAATSAGGVKYLDALHPDVTGVIIVTT